MTTAFIEGRVYLDLEFQREKSLSWQGDRAANGRHDSRGGELRAHIPNG